MIYRIMLVEDEPPTMRNIEKKLLSCGVQNISLVAKASNGAEALALIPQTQPHIIFSDVKMPVMDGFALVEEVQRLYPDILIVILSGYQDFDYVKKALLFRLQDYLLKPVEEEELALVLEKLKITIDRTIYQATAKYLRDCLEGHPPTLPLPGILHHYDIFMLNAGLFYDSAIWPESLPTASLEKNQVYHVFSGLAPQQYTWVLECGSFNRFLVVIGFPTSPSPDLEPLLRRGIAQLSSPLPLTLTYTSADTPAEISPAISRVLIQLRQALIPNVPQLLRADVLLTPSMPPPIPHSEAQLLKTLLEQHNLKSFSLALSHFLSQAIPLLTTQDFLERVLQSVLSLLKNSLPQLSADDVRVLEGMVGEILLPTCNPQRLTQEFITRVNDFLLHCHHFSASDPTMEGVINRVASYLEQHFNEDIEFRTLAAQFGISHTYLSTLYKKYYGVTPTKYLLTLRVTRAKELISSQPDIPFRQVSALVGYEDSHYFSRIFCSMTGCTPSEFRTTFFPL